MQENDSLPTIEIPLHWKQVLLGNGRFDWHKKKVRAYSDRDQLAGAKVYKWVFRGVDGIPTEFYIGQCADFKERLGKYRTVVKADGSTEALVQSAARKCEEQGGSVDLEFLDLGTPLLVNGKLVDQYALGDLDVRLMMESIAIVSMRASGFKLVNRLGDNAYYRQILALMESIVERKGKRDAMKFLRSCLLEGDDD